MAAVLLLFPSGLAYLLAVPTSPLSAPRAATTGVAQWVRLVVPSPELLAVASGTVAIIVSSSNSIVGLVAALSATKLLHVRQLLVCVTAVLMRPLQAHLAPPTERHFVVRRRFQWHFLYCDGRRWVNGTTRKMNVFPMRPLPARVGRPTEGFAATLGAEIEVKKVIRIRPSPLSAFVGRLTRVLLILICPRRAP